MAVQDYAAVCEAHHSTEAVELLMRHRSKTNSHKFRDLELQRDYKLQFDYCEVSPWLRRNWPEMYFRDDVLDLHHLCRGKGRRDYWSLMIRVNATFHDIVTNHDEFNCNIVCMAVKVRKNEFNMDEFRMACGSRLEGWLTKQTPRPEVRGLWDELMALAVTQNQERL
jgi:hypothetical protein